MSCSENCFLKRVQFALNGSGGAPGLLGRLGVLRQELEPLVGCGLPSTAAALSRRGIIAAPDRGLWRFRFFGAASGTASNRVAASARSPLLTML